MRQYPELTVFITLAIGFATGKIKIGSFSLGPVTGVLLIGVLIGQLKFDISPTVKSTFFLLFLFAVGYGVGPQFMHSLKKEGLPQIAFASIICIICLAVSWVAAIIAGFDIGNAAGLLAGANTISAVIGVSSDMIGQLAIETEEKRKLINEIPVAYAVTYIFGTAGTAWFLSYVGPKMLGGNIVERCKEYEKTLGGSIAEEDPALEPAYEGAVFRAYELNQDYFTKERTVLELESLLVQKDWPVFVDRIRTKEGKIIDNITPDMLLYKGDSVLLNGPVDTLLKDEVLIGTEVYDLELISNFRVEVLKVTVKNKEIAGKSLQELKSFRERQGVIIRNIERSGTAIPLLPGVKIQRGDVIELEGPRENTERFASLLGFIERPTNITDILYVGLGIFVGGILGSLTVHINNVPFSMSVSGGVLIAGLIFGWIHSLRPSFGSIPGSSLWLMNNLGLNVFIAIVGISAGPDFMAGLKASGISLFLAGIVISIIPMFIGLLLGRYVFKFHPGITLGACAGSRVTTAALGAVLDVTQSRIPALSYTITYAVGNTLLIIWGVVIVLLMS